ncbi:protein LYRIC-like isoform X2 [Xyrauchen texanus]|uniref:protein LYRIC-like isoform X2 n=1 Tax=Xyrauchen texanus TaxID=154827 RepID=UPI002242B670|nr:protein LYRIC-like isoform X2 [Xyrauchen texanus]
MALGWQEIAAQHVEQITGYVREILSSGLVFLKAELGIDLGLNPDQCAPWVLLLTAWVGLVLMLVLWVSVCRGVSKRFSVEIDNTGPAPPVTKPDLKADEPKRRNRKKTSDKKAHRNGLAVEPLEDAMVVENQGPQDMKTDKAKKNKKKPKQPVKEKKSSTSAVGKEPDEGTWETKVSNREKRQQRRKDKTTGDGSASPKATVVESAISVMEQVYTSPEEPETTTTASTPPVHRKVDVEPPQIEASYARDNVIPQVTPCWQEVLSVNGSGWSDLGLQLPPQMSSVQAESWTSMSLSTEHQITEPSVWPQDMEGSWTIVDKLHIPVSFSGLNAVPDLSWSAQPPLQVDDEWSGINSASADPLSDWNAPSEEWGNYVEQHPVRTMPLEQPVLEVAQESDTEKEKDEVGAPGNCKAKKKKKKKKVEDVGPSVQSQVKKAERDTSAAAQALSTTGNIFAATAGTRVEEVTRAVSSAPVQMQQRPEPTDKPTTVTTQKKTEDSWESPKQVKKKKARRET